MGLLSRRRRTADEAYGAASAPGEAPPVEPMVAASFAFHRLKWLDDFKGFVLFGTFNLMYMLLSTMRTDWFYAFETRERYERSRIAIGAPEFDERDTFPELVDFLNIDLDNLTTDLEKKCKNCRVAITGANKDLKDLDLEEFVCTDFDSISGLDSYPDRDCKAVDYDYALEPDAMKAPCCLNQSLVQASMAIMTWTKWAPEFLDRDFLTPGVISIGDLVAIDDRFNDGPPNFGAEGLALWKREVFTRINQDLPPMVQRAGSYLYVNSAVDTGFIAQVIISREQRMVGIECNANWLDEENSPFLVIPAQTFWSYNFNENPEMVVCRVLLWIFYALTLLHEVQQFYSECLTWREVRAAACTPYYCFFFASSLAPVLVEIIKANLTVVQWTLWMSITQLIMFMRTFIEGQCLLPFRLIIATIRHASINLAYVMSIVLVTAIVIMLIYGQLFGIFDPHLTMGTWGLARIFKMLTSPPPLEVIHVTQSPVGAITLYYWTTAVIRLTFGSFVIAVIVGSFNHTRLELMKEKEKLAILPAGLESLVVPRKWHDGFWEVTWYLLTWRLYGHTMPHLHRTLHRLIADDKAKTYGDDVLYTMEVLRQNFHVHTANAMRDCFAVGRIADRDGMRMNTRIKKAKLAIKATYTKGSRRRSNASVSNAEMASQSRNLLESIDNEEGQLLQTILRNQQRLEELRLERKKRSDVDVKKAELAAAMMGATEVLRKVLEDNDNGDDMAGAAAASMRVQEMEMEMITAGAC